MHYERTVIDGHYHIYDWFNQDGISFWDTTGQYRDGRGFQAVNIMALPSYDGRDVSQNIMIALYKLRHPDFYAHGGLFYDVYPVPAVMTEGMDPLTQYKEMMKIGFDGIKMEEGKPTEIKEIGRTLDEPLYEDYFAQIEKDGTSLYCHVNDPDINWDVNRIPRECLENGGFYDDTYPSYEEIYECVLRVLERHPALKVTFTHFFFMSEDPERLEKIFAKYPGVCVDLTPGIEMYGGFEKRHDFYYDFFNRYADRILYGTDANDGRIDNAWFASDLVYDFLTTERKFDVAGHQFRGLNLPEETTEKILWKNFFKRTISTPKLFEPIRDLEIKIFAKKYEP